MRFISLCSGVEAASMAWLPLGWECVACAEFDQFPSAVLANRFPDTPNLGDVTKVDWSQYHGAADLVVFGSPCQSFSVSGLRMGLDDPRGQLMLECLAACRDIDPEWVVFENVPGLLSSDGGRAFETFLNAVAILWPRGGVAWRILDSQWFGIPQRRRRVFAVINTRDWRRAAAVLLDEHCLRGNPPTRGEAGKDASSDAGLCTETCDRDGCMTPWDVQSRRVFTEETRWPALYAGEGGGHGHVAKRDDQSINCFKWLAGAKARTVPAYEDCITPTLTNSDSHQPAVAIAQNETPVIMASGQANAEISGPGKAAPTIAARNYKDPPILFDHPQSSGRLVLSNGQDVVGALCARDYKGVGSQFVDEGKVIFQIKDGIDV